MVGEACDGMEAVEGCRASAPDVALLDIQMPLLDGVSVARQFWRTGPPNVSLS